MRSVGLLLLLVISILQQHSTANAQSTAAICEAAQDGCFCGTWQEVTAVCKRDNDLDCCDGTGACRWPLTMTVTVCPGSCKGTQACDFSDKDLDPYQTIAISRNSCVGDDACSGLGKPDDYSSFQEVTVGAASCHGKNACEHFRGSVIGKSSCNGVDENGNSYACQGATGNVGAGSCTAATSCTLGGGVVGDQSCTALESCYQKQGIVGHGSCTTKQACSRGKGDVGNASCTGAYDEEHYMGACADAGNIGDCVAMSHAKTVGDVVAVSRSLTYKLGEDGLGFCWDEKEESISRPIGNLRTPRMEKDD